MKQFNPFAKVNCSYGAPMGRYSDNPANLAGIKRLHARFQGGGEGYDRGGAYWGSPCNVWAVWAHLHGKRSPLVAIAHNGDRTALIGLDDDNFCGAIMPIGDGFVAVPDCAPDWITGARLRAVEAEEVAA